MPAAGQPARRALERSQVILPQHEAAEFYNAERVAKKTPVRPEPHLQKRDRT